MTQEEINKLIAERDTYKQMLIDGKVLCTCERSTLRDGSVRLCFICDRETASYELDRAKGEIEHLRGQKNTLLKRIEDLQQQLKQAKEHEK